MKFQVSNIKSFLILLSALFSVTLASSEDEKSLLCTMFPHLCETSSPSAGPSISQAPTYKPSNSAQPTASMTPTSVPSSVPTTHPTYYPTLTPTDNPSKEPTALPTAKPTKSRSPSSSPSFTPTRVPSDKPSLAPSSNPTPNPTMEPTTSPSYSPIAAPSNNPSGKPTDSPTYGPRPNLIMIMTDEHNLRTLGCYRDQLKADQAYVWGEGIQVETPHIDRLAAEGALFTNYYAATPLCTPSRASFMTGLYSPKTGGSRFNHGAMDDDVTTFAQVLQEQRGYYTGYFGKWHLNGDEKPGWGNDKRKFGFMDTTYQFNQGHWKFLDKVNGQMMEYEFRDRKMFQGREETHYTTDYLVDRSIEFMDTAQARNEPFAMVISIPDPHAPNEVRQPYEDMYTNVYFEVPSTGKMTVRKNPATPKWNYHDHEGVPLIDADNYLDEFEKSDRYQSHLNQYFGMVKLIDDNVGKLLDYLDTNGLAEDTVIVFTSDHGDMLGEHGKYNKGRPYRTSGGIPFILRYPAKVQAGKVVQSAYTNVDFAPSILSLMGVDNHGLTFDGENFLDELMIYYPTTNYPWTKLMFDPAQGRWVAAFMRNYRLVISTSDIPWLFDLRLDPFEVINFFDEPGYESIQNSLLSYLHKALNELDIPLTTEQKYILWSKPACYDSIDRVEVDSQYYTCDDIGKSLPFEKCSDEILQQHCPVTCESCCEDSKGDLLVNGFLRRCDELRFECGKNRVQKFCPVTCNVCSRENENNIFVG